MLALSPPFSTFGWPSEDPTTTSHVHCDFVPELAGTSDRHSFRHHSPPDLSQATAGIGEFKRSEVAGDAMKAKKLNHNASERDRRKRINSLYSSLRSLLPGSDDQLKKLSIPATVSRVLKYIPELQREVDRLVQKKEELTSRITRQEDLVHRERQRKCSTRRSLSAVSATPLGDGEVVIQICTTKAHKTPPSEILQHLEEDGLLLLDGSYFESSGERVLYNLHLLQVQGTQRVEFEMLRDKLLSLFEKREALFP